MINADNFLSEVDFRGVVLPSPGFRIVAERMMLAGAEAEQVLFACQYDRHGGLRLDASTHVSPMRLLAGNLPNARLEGSELPKPVELLLTRVNSEEIVFVPRSSPILFDFRKPAVRAEAIILNGPSLRFCGSKLDLLDGQYRFRLKEFAETKAYHEQKRLHRHDRVATGTLALTSRDNRPIDPDEAFSLLGRATHFLTMLRGGHCALGNVRGLDKNGELAFLFAGFGKADPFEVESGWCDREVIGAAPSFFGAYLALRADEDKSKVVVRAVDYYRASNVARETSPQMALVASYAGLETLVPHILSSEAGWTNKAIKGTAFAGLIREAVAHVGLSGDPLEHAPQLLQRQQAEMNIDAYDLLALFRNRVTHYKKGFKMLPLELMEAWQVSQWLSELFLIHLLGHRGQMNDRRRYSGWAGPAVPIPLP